MISIIIPALNEEDSIGATLEYLKGCIADAKVEIIVADGGSKDKTSEIASKYGVSVLTGTDSSRAFLMNLGAKEAKGDVLFFLHADSYPPETFVADIKQALKDEYVVGGAFDHRFSEDVFLIKVVCFFNRIRFRITKNYYGDQGIFVRKDIFERLGGYKNMRILEDLDFSERLKKVGKTVLIRKRMLTSGRRFIKNGVIRTSMFMIWVRLLYVLGFDTERFAKTYRTFNTPTLPSPLEGEG
ncbi:MAG TPA: TIGR04283 family arsenosugar biosynthesis glycosyltransferase [Candidatus Brocadiia bacterium]|nr:TIGR04283 family arsenosugar biosynthesis glycosyltransferase [Planctomycetota bacterium]MDO8094624.1 TIGR04283 family arsenosugar biosynthesis glycosyltransferase [Candidatus Brocadiales bacterium]